MTTDEALDFLARHQPMPDDKSLTQDLIDRYDEVRRHFLAHDDVRSVPLFLNSFGEGTGWGVYQLVEDVLRRYPREAVVRSLADSLASPHAGVRGWSLQIAMEYPDRSLAPHFKRLLSSDRPDERLWAAYNLEGVYSPKEDAELLMEASGSETDPEVIEILARTRARTGR